MRLRSRVAATGRIAMDIPDIIPPHAERSRTLPDVFKPGAPVPASSCDLRYGAARRAGPLDDDDDDDEGDSWSKGGDDDDDDEDEDDDLDDEDEDSADSVWAC
jgi:hypothetical protein